MNRVGFAVWRGGPALQSVLKLCVCVYVSVWVLRGPRHCQLPHGPGQGSLVNSLMSVKTDGCQLYPEVPTSIAPRSKLGRLMAPNALGRWHEHEGSLVSPGHLRRRMFGPAQSNQEFLTLAG